MAQPKRKTSKMKKRQRKAPSRYVGIQAGLCTECGAGVMPHRACPECGNYGGEKVIEVEAAD
jgi:large subunit ribosomal protein L32